MRAYKKILVIGGSGFIGRNLINSLVSHGLLVRNLDRFKPGWSDSRVEFVEGDFSASHLLDQVMNSCDVVYHLASTTLPKTSNDDPQFDITTNLVGAVNLLELSVRKGIKKFIFISSGGTVYGAPASLPVSENHPNNPTCSYGIVKLAIEKYLKLFHKSHGLDTCSLRLSNPYGPYQRVDSIQGAVTIFCNKAINDETIEIWGDGSIKRDFIYIDDAVRAMVSTLANDFSGQEINIGTGIGTSLNDLIQIIESILDKKIDVSYKAPRDFDIKDIYLDIQKARKLLDWEPEIGLKAGMEHLIQWMINSKEKIA
ncbi:NAD-dependent epimerase/dehydratase family protein [Desulfuromonas sp. TF]|uniref:NAD-dependent epimerase/dehydratase family protein n=1 Tax=Desulfuromonas sp. TF TaxID=1232410 RepID=UPI00055506DE|nr:NAD-dependent epimerase/dehydratase family protein [Desulfuromonas sp. TF]